MSRRLIRLTGRLAAGAEHTVAARYAWCNAPAANLYNRAGLPPSRSTEW